MATTFLHSSQKSRDLVEQLLDELFETRLTVATSVNIHDDEKVGDAAFARFAHTFLSLQLNVLKYTAESTAPAADGVAIDPVAAVNVTRFRLANSVIRTTLLFGTPDDAVNAMASQHAENTTANGQDGVALLLPAVFQLLEATGWKLERSGDSSPEWWCQLRLDNEEESINAKFGVSLEWAQKIDRVAQTVRRSLEVASSDGAARGGFGDFLATVDPNETPAVASLRDNVVVLNRVVSAISAHAKDAVQHGRSRAIRVEEERPLRQGASGLNDSQEEGAPPPPPRRTRPSDNGSSSAESDAASALVVSSNRQTGSASTSAPTLATTDNLVDAVNQARERRRQPKPEVEFNAAVDKLLAAPGTATRSESLLREALNGFEAYATKSAVPVEARFAIANNYTLAQAAAYDVKQTWERPKDGSTAATRPIGGLSRESPKPKYDAEDAITWMRQLPDGEDCELHVMLLLSVSASRALGPPHRVALAVPPLEKAIQICAQHDLYRLKLIAEHNLARVLERQGEFGAALGVITAALELADRLDDKAMTCRLLGARLMCHAMLQDGVQMLAAMQQLHEVRFTCLPHEHNIIDVETAVHRAPLLPKALTALTSYGRFRVFPLPLALGSTTTQQQLHDALYTKILTEVEATSSTAPREGVANGDSETDRQQRVLSACDPSPEKYSVVPYKYEPKRFGAEDPAVRGAELLARQESGGAVSAALAMVLDHIAKTNYSPTLLTFAMWFHISPDRNVLLRQEPGADSDGIVIW